MKQVHGHRYACEQAHSFVSLRLDGELSQLEDALLDAHLADCAACRVYAGEVEGLTTELRAAAPERLGHPIALPAIRRRVTLRQLQTAAVTATAAAAAMLGVAIGIDSALPKESELEAAPAFFEPVAPERELQLRARATRTPGQRGDDFAL